MESSAKATRSEYNTSRSDDEAIARLSKLAACAQRTQTDSDAGSMVWHSWGSGPPLVLLHGGAGSWTHWVHNIAHFMTQRQVLVADLPGLGDSPDPPAPYSADSIAQIVSAGIKQLLPAAPQVDLVGFSFGGIIAGHVAALNKVAVRTLVIVGSPPFGLGSDGPSNEIRAVDAALPFEQSKELHRHNLELFMIADPQKVDALALRIHHDNLRRSRLRSRKIARTGTLVEALRAAPCPAHGIWGAEDVTVYPDMTAIAELFKVREGGSFELLPAAGHWAAYEDPESFNRVLDKRLRG